MSNKNFVRTCGVFLALVLGAQASAADADILRQANDRAEIEALMWRYVRALDTYDVEAYANVFTEDGRFGTGANATVGRAALRQMVDGLKRSSQERQAAGEPRGPMHHVITNAHIEFVGADEAKYHSYWMTVFGPQGQGGQPQVAAVGRGVDVLVRVDGQWLIKSRDVAPQD